MASTHSILSDQGFTGKQIVILGLARQGLVLARFFAHAGALVTVSDLASAEQLEAERRQLDGLPIRYVLEGHPLSLLDGCDLLCLSGGVPPQLPIVQEAIREGIPLSNDSLLTFQFAYQMGLGPTIAVTGSSGKTTTTTLIGRMLEAAGQIPHVGGNIGLPILDRLGTIYRAEPIVLELSSFQLELFDPALAYGNFDNIGPQIAALLNITPNHLDRHPNMAAYAAAKLNFIRHMPRGASLILNRDDAVTARLIPDLEAEELPRLPASWQLDALLEETQNLIRRQNLQVIPFSRTHSLTRGAWLEADSLVLNGEEICRRDAVLLPGDHNISNLLAAMATASAAGAWGLQVPNEALHTVAREFTGVAHRLEIVADHNDVIWINDSIATSPERAVAGLRAVAAGRSSGQSQTTKGNAPTIVLLAGGKDKNLPWDEFADEIVNHVDFLIGFGQCGPMIVELVQDCARYRQQKAPNCAVVQRLEEAVALAGRIARAKTIVLLSPGGTSYDTYRDFEARGEHFRQLAQEQTAQAVQQNGIATHIGVERMKDQG